MVIKNYPISFTGKKVSFSANEPQKDEPQKFVRLETDPFSDVNKGDWFEPAISHGVKKGYIAGFPVEPGETKPKFKPNDIVTRAQTAAFLNAYDNLVVIPLAQKVEKLEQKIDSLEASLRKN